MGGGVLDGNANAILVPTSVGGAARKYQSYLEFWARSVSGPEEDSS
jgi:hypothetical protein